MEKNQINIDGFNYPLAKVRQDLLDEEIAVPVGKNYYASAEPLAYHWKDGGDEEFEVYLNGKWQSAESIDFDFL